MATNRSKRSGLATVGRPTSAGHPAPVTTTATSSTPSVPSMAAPTHRPAPRRSRAKAVAQAPMQDPRAMAVPAVPLPFPVHGSPSVVPFQPHALLAPAKDPQQSAPVSGSAGASQKASVAAVPLGAEASALGGLHNPSTKHGPSPQRQTLWSPPQKARRPLPLRPRKRKPPP